MSNTNNFIFDPETVRGFVEEIDGIEDDNLSLHGTYMSARQANNERKGEVFEKVKAAGIPIKGFKLELKRRKAEAMLDLLSEKADADDLRIADDLRASLGAFADTGLGAAAVERAASRRSKGNHAAAQ